MKHFLKISLSSLIIFICFISCDKKGNAIDDEKIQTERIEDIIPKQYLDTLDKLDFVIHKGINPPTLNGIFSIKPHILDTSNIVGDRPGYRFNDAVVTLFGQNNSDFSIKLLGEHFINDRDTSISTAISGSDNKFTVYGKVKSTSGSNYAILGLLVSGELDAEGNIKNTKSGIIMIDDSKGGTSFIKNGQARIAYDSDFVSERIGEAQGKVKTGRQTDASLSTRVLENNKE